MKRYDSYKIVTLYYWNDYKCLNDQQEAQTFTTEQNSKGETMSDIAAQIAALPKENKLRSRIVIITQGKDEVIVVQGIHYWINFNRFSTEN